MVVLIKGDSDLTVFTLHIVWWERSGEGREWGHAGKTRSDP